MRCRIYRARAYYTDPSLDTSRRFLTKHARDAWAKRRLDGYEEDVPDGVNFLDDPRPAIPPAARVILDESSFAEFTEPHDGEKAL